MKIKIDKFLFSIGKLLIFLLYMYLNWYKDIWGNNLFVLYGLSLTLFAVIAAALILERKLSLEDLPNTLRFYFGFTLYALISGLFVSENTSFLISSVISFFSFSAICFCAWVIITNSGTTDWLFKIFILCGAVCALQLLLFGKPYDNGVIVVTLGPNNNPNTLGLVFVFAIIAIVFLSEKTQKYFAVSLAAIAVLFYCIILTGARKMFISAVLFVLFWLLYLALGKKQRRKRLKRWLKFFVIIILVLLLIRKYGTNFLSSALYSRIELMRQEGLDSIRAKLYIDAFNIWKEHPVFGIGYNQYQLYSPYHLYSHSTYAETLACCGIIGVLFLLNNLFGLGKSLFTSIRYYRKNTLLLACFFVELFLFSVQIYYYDLNHMLLLLLLSCSTKVNIRNGKRSGNAE